MLREAARALRECRPVLLLDSPEREGEVDLVYYAGCVDWRVVREARRLAGGLPCYAMPREAWGPLGLKFATDILASAGFGGLVKLPPYGEPPAFSLWVNHTSARTGVRDRDRAATIRALHEVTLLALEGRIAEAKRRLVEEFAAPGHTPVLLERGLEFRRGHTELSLALARLAGLPPSTFIVEVLSDDGEAATPEEAVWRFPGAPLLTGDEVVAEWEKRMRKA